MLECALSFVQTPGQVQDCRVVHAQALQRQPGSRQPLAEPLAEPHHRAARQLAGAAACGKCASRAWQCHASAIAYSAAVLAMSENEFDVYLGPESHFDFRSPGQRHRRPALVADRTRVESEPAIATGCQLVLRVNRHRRLCKTIAGFACLALWAHASHVPHRP